MSSPDWSGTVEWISVMTGWILALRVTVLLSQSRNSKILNHVKTFNPLQWYPSSHHNELVLAFRAWVNPLLPLFFFSPTGYYLLHIIYVPVVHLPLHVFSITFPCTKTARTDHKAGTFQIIQKVFYPSCFTILRLREHIIARKSSRHKSGTRSTIAITNKWANGYLKCEKQAVCAWKHKYFSQP